MGRHPLPLAASPALARGLPRPRPVPSLPSVPLPALRPTARVVPSVRSLLAEAARDHHRAIERHADAAAVTEAADADLARALEQADAARARLRRGRRGLALTVEVHALVRAAGVLRDARTREAAARGEADDAALSVAGSSHDLDAARRARDEAHDRLMAVLPVLCRARARLLDARAEQAAAREEEGDAADRLTRATADMVRAGGTLRR